ncbi:MAG: glycosyltransferase family 4 protein [Patescibacteria group bacterium]
MNKTIRLLVITQAVDQEDSALGFFCEWLEAFAADARVESVEVLCLRNGKWDSMPSNVSIKILPSGILARIIYFYLFILPRRFDAIFVHMTPIWAVLGGLLWRLTGQRLLLWYTHGTKTKALSTAVWFADKVCTATPEAFPIKTPKMIAMGHGIGSGFANVSRISHDNGDLRFISVGRISERKAVKQTVAFFGKIKEICSVARFTWIGEPLTGLDIQYFGKVREEITRLNLKDSFEFRGSVLYRDMPKIYSESDCLIHLSETGSLDKVVIESMAAGCSVFSTNSATKEALPDAYWNDSLGVDAANEAVRRARHGVSVESRIVVNQGFSLSALIERIINVAFFT